MEVEEEVGSESSNREGEWRLLSKDLADLPAPTIPSSASSSLPSPSSERHVQHAVSTARKGVSVTESDRISAAENAGQTMSKVVAREDIPADKGLDFSNEAEKRFVKSAESALPTRSHDTSRPASASFTPKALSQTAQPLCTATASISSPEPLLRGGTARRAEARGASNEVDKARQMLQNMSPMTFAKEAEASSSVELALSMELLGVACASPGMQPPQKSLLTKIVALEQQVLALKALHVHVRRRWEDNRVQRCRLAAARGAWDAWHMAVFEVQMQHYMTEQIAVGLRAASRGLHAACEQCRLSDALRRHAVKRQRVILARLYSDRQRRRLRSAVAAWGVEGLAERRRARAADQAADKMRTRHKTQKLAAAIDAWTGHTHTAVTRRQRVCHATLAHAYRTAHQMVRAWRAGLERARARAHSARATQRRACRRRALVAWQGWRRFVTGRHLLAHCVMLATVLGLRRGWRRWRAAVVAAHERMRRVRCIRRLVRRRASKALDDWRRCRLSDAYMHSCFLFLCTQTRSLSLSLSRARALSLICTRINARTRARAHTHTHTHTKTGGSATQRDGGGTSRERCDGIGGEQRELQ